ncbi:MAG: SDR family oxidoreductase [Verrucomicrobiales bacterium]|jgi:NAD(P)-dependent dehydrogenase (short-subunit alcohol dehydrogenase family)|nr:SDR family oxidoreductase [Verrucomicrobiales bacterium]
MKSNLFDIGGRVYVVTGAAGVLGNSVARYLAAQKAKVVWLEFDIQRLETALAQCKAETPDAEVLGLQGNVLDRASLEAARDAVLKKYGRVDGLLNGAGGNMAGATIAPDKSFFDLDMDAFRKVVDLNLNGTVLPSLVFAPEMMKGGRGAIVNYSSVSAFQVLTRVVGYSASKGAVTNFTRWLAVDMARNTGGKVRVNAVMPGFFIGEQNRRLLTNEDGSLTERGQLVIQNTPFGRFGEADELHGAIHYLLSDAASFVTGSVLEVDGGFCAFSGV